MLDIGSLETGLFDPPEPIGGLDVGKADPELLGMQDYAIEQASRKYFKRGPLYPNRSIFADLPGNIVGMEADLGYNKFILYDKDKLETYPGLKEKTATEEAIHSQQEGKELLLPLTLVYCKEVNGNLIPLYIIPIGRILYEGGVRPIAEKTGLPKPDSYPEDWYNMAEEIEEEIPLREWYDAAERDKEEYGELNRVLDFLDNDKIKEIIHKYALKPESSIRYVC